MWKALTAGLAAGALALLASPAFAKDTLDCSKLLAFDGSSEGRSLRAEDLIGLIDIGSIPDFDDVPMFTISPDGSSIAVGVRRAIPSANSYCSGVYIVSKDGSARLVDSGEGTIFWKFPVVLGKANFPTGFPKVITPRWTQDGRSISFLKEVDGVPQVWMVNVDGTDGGPVTNSPREIVDFRLSDDGLNVIAKMTNDSQASADRDREALSGYHLDDRFSPIATSRPFLKGLQPSEFTTWNLASGLSRPATSEEIELFDTASRKTATDTWIAGKSEDEKGVSHIAAHGAGRERLCQSALCTQAIGTPWISGGNHIRYLRRTGWANNEMAVYDWKIGGGTPDEIYKTQDLLLDCKASGTKFICAREASLKPRHLVSIDPASGNAKILFDPNPSFAKLPLGNVKRLYWRNADGIPCWGDLVFPVGFKDGVRYPLIVVQYTSRGFLRGGTGDEYPIQLFANEGYLVLNVQRLPSPLAGREDLPSIERIRAELEGFRERRSILSAIESKVHELIDAGLADPVRVGITGLSDGASTVQFALVNSALFSAASVSTCCWEQSQAWTLGPAIEAYYRQIGWPGLTDDRPEFWKQISLARNVAHITTPLLLQPSDDEYLATLESVTALREAGKPVDLYVFPDEHHVKWQPAHRLAIYQRNLDWFNFWLRGRAPSLAPDHVEAAERWKALCLRVEARVAEMSCLTRSRLKEG